MIDLITFNGECSDWKQGKSKEIPFSTESICELIEKRQSEPSEDYTFFWDMKLGAPDEKLAVRLAKQYSDIWHGGLALGTRKAPAVLKHVDPVNLLHCDPDPGTEGVSWRMSFRACLAKNEVLKTMGKPDARFECADMMALNYGYRLIKQGVMVRTAPELLPETHKPLSFSVKDESLFIKNHYGKKWMYWICLRKLPRISKSLEYLMEQIKTRNQEAYYPLRAYSRSHILSENSPAIKVSAIIPTLKRYSYLKAVVQQLEEQTVKLHEIVIVDQTPIDEREKFDCNIGETKIRYYAQDKRGQCYSRNEAMAHATGDAFLFLDDDDDFIPADLVERLLKHFCCAEISMVGVGVDERGCATPPQADLLCRAAYIFPKCITKRSAIEKSGCFDNAYNTGIRADADIGMRLVKSGAVMLIDPTIRVYHHRAPAGGLREHHVRKITESSSKAKLFEFNRPIFSEYYLAERHFERSYRYELNAIRFMQNFVIEGSWVIKIIKILVTIVCIPGLFYSNYKAGKRANGLLAKDPDIPSLTSL